MGKRGNSYRVLNPAAKKVMDIKKIILAEKELRKYTKTIECHDLNFELKSLINRTMIDLERIIYEFDFI